MKTVYKYEFSLHGTRQSLTMPSGAVIVSVQPQNNLPCVWAIVDDEQPPVERTFEIYQTGRRVDEPGRSYIGTWLIHDGSYVIHLFEVVGVVRPHTKNVT